MADLGAFFLYYRNGGFTAFNRIGLASNVSPFTKMSYGECAVCH